MNTGELDLFLPVEIVLQILFYLNAKELMLLSKVNKDFNFLINDESIWKHLYHNVKTPLYDISNYKEAYKKLYPHIDKYIKMRKFADDLTQIIPTIRDPLHVGSYLKKLALSYNPSHENALHGTAILYKQIIKESYSRHSTSTHHGTLFSSKGEKNSNTLKIINDLLAVLPCTKFSTTVEVNYLQDLKDHLNRYPSVHNKVLLENWNTKIESVQAKFQRAKRLFDELFHPERNHQPSRRFR